MQALGLIETKGLVVAVESADAMLKAAKVTLIEKTYVGGGLVSITITGEVSAVNAAVEAGAAAVNQINSGLLVAQHVIPRPDEELQSLIYPAKQLENVKGTTSEIENTKQVVVKEKLTFPSEVSGEEVNKKTIDTLVFQYSLEEVLEFLSKLKVTKLRKLAREYKKIGIAGRLISKANKKTLLEEFHQYYLDENKQNN